MYLTTLGGLTLTPGDFRRPKPLLLLAYLAVEGAKEKRHLYELFWPGATDPANSLRTVIKLFRQVNAELLESDEHTVKTTVENDFTRLQSIISERAVDNLSEVYKGEFLQGFSLPDWSSELEEWVYSTREFIAARVRGALLRVAEREAAKGKFLEAGQWAEKAYGLSQDQDPEDLERLYPLLLAGDSALGSEVKKQAKDYGLELNLSREEAKARYFALTSEGEVETRNIPNNLPRAKTSFIGRDPELVEVGQMLGQAEVQLVTLLGPGGMGKTRLALQVAYGQLQEPHFVDGIYFVALDVLSESEQIPLVIAQTLGLNLQSKDDPFTVVKGAIGNKHVLLVLDNFEQLMDGAMMVSELLGSCPNLVILVTSRERLNLEEEFVLTLQGLPLPKADGTGLSNVEYNDALKLFVQRAKRGRLDFQLSEENLPFVLEVCKLVDGSPLGIELAAAWLRSLTPADLVRELRKSMDVLETSSRNIVARHQSLRAVFEHSWNLLKPKEQTTLAMLTVFVGGFTREAAAQVTDATIPLLTSLVDKSLLKLTPEGRYERHALLYQLAHTKLSADPALQQEMQRKHLAYYLALAEATAPKLASAEQTLWLEHLQSELDNFRAALAFTITAEKTESGLRLALALSDFWLLRNFHEGYQQLTEILSLPVTNAEITLRIKTLNSVGKFASSIERYAEAKSYYEEALTLAQKQSDNDGIAGALLGLGELARLQGDYRAAQGLFEKSLALYRTLDEKRNLARVLNNLGITFLYRGQPSETKPLYEEALRLHQTLGDPQRIALSLSNLGAISEELEDFTAAEQYYQQSLGLARAIGDKSFEAISLHNLAGCFIRTRGGAETIRAYFTQSFALFLELDTKHDALWCLSNIAMFESDTKHYALALRLAGVITGQTAVLGISFPEYHLNRIAEKVQEATEALGKAVALKLQNEGRKMSLTKVLGLLKETANDVIVQTP
jgi:predicted ATPase/Tfp pilus assembly protein PilF